MIDDSAAETWKCTTYHGKYGRGFQYSNTAIETHDDKGILSLYHHAFQSFINSIFKLMEVPLTSLDYTCISKRSKMVEVKYRNKSRGRICHLTSLKYLGMDLMIQKSAMTYCNEKV